MIDGLAIIIKIGDEDVPGWLPLLPQRFALEGAWRAALGYQDGDEAIPTGNSSEADFAAVLSAVVGSCWAGVSLELIQHRADGPRVVSLPPGPQALRQFDRDLIGFGEAVLDALVRRGYNVGDIYDAGRHVRGLLLDSIPTQKEVDETADFTEATAADFTEPTSN